MQRTGLFVATVLVLLAGCSGGMGGNGSATPTPEPTATQPPAPNPTPSSATPEPAASTIEVVDADPANAPVVQGQPARIQATLANAGDVIGRQTVALTNASGTVAQTTVRIDAGESASVTLRLSNTSGLRPGQHRYTVRTANDTRLVAFTVEENRTYAQFLGNVTDRTVDVRQTRVFSNDLVGIAFEPNREHARTYAADDDVMPAVQATALEMARDPDAPPTVHVMLVTGEGPVWGVNLTTDLARGYANGSLTPAEFRRTLTRRADGTEGYADRTPEELPALLTLTTGDRARRAYARELAERLENSTWNEHITVTDYGLYNGTVHLPDTTRTLGPNASIYVEFQTPRDTQMAEYRYFNSTERGIPKYETIYKWGNLSAEKKHGEVPKSVQMRFVDRSGTKYLTVDLPTTRALAATDQTNDTTPTEVLLSLEFSTLSEQHNGGMNP